MSTSRTKNYSPSNSDLEIESQNSEDKLNQCMLPCLTSDIIRKQEVIRSSADVTEIARALERKNFGPSLGAILI